MLSSFFYEYFVHGTSSGQASVSRAPVSSPPICNASHSRIPSPQALPSTKPLSRYPLPTRTMTHMNVHLCTGIAVKVWRISPRSQPFLSLSRTRILLGERFPLMHLLFCSTQTLWGYGYISCRGGVREVLVDISGLDGPIGSVSFSSCRPRRPLLSPLVSHRFPKRLSLSDLSCPPIPLSHDLALAVSPSVFVRASRFSRMSYCSIRSFARCASCCDRCSGCGEIQDFADAGCVGRFGQYLRSCRAYSARFLLYMPSRIPYTISCAIVSVALAVVVQ